MVALSLLHPKFLSLIPLRMYRVVLSSAQCRWGQSRTLFKRWRHPPQDLPGSSSITDSRHHAHLGRELQTGEKGGQAGERVSANHSRPWINIRYIPRGSDIANARMPDKRSNQVTTACPPPQFPCVLHRPKASLTTVDIVHAVMIGSIVLWRSYYPGPGLGKALRVGTENE